MVLTVYKFCAFFPNSVQCAQCIISEEISDRSQNTQNEKFSVQCSKKSLKKSWNTFGLHIPCHVLIGYENIGDEKM